MTDAPTTFGACLDQWMAEHELSGAAVAAMTGAKSATSISRLRNDKCTAKRCEAFLAALLEAYPALVSAKEEQRFRRSLEAAKRSSGAFTQAEGFHRLMLPAEIAPLAPSLPETLIRLPADMAEGQLLCFHSADAALFRKMQSLLARFGDRLHIRCFIPAPWPCNTLRFAIDALPLLCDPRCVIATLPPGMNQPSHLSVLRYRKAGGPWQEELLLLSAGKLHTLPMPEGCGLYDFFANLAAPAEAINPPQPLSTPESCLAFLERCYAREAGAEICMLQAGPCMEFFPIEVLQDAASGVDAMPGYEQQALAIRRAVYLRFANQCEKKKPTHLLLSRAALERFMDTGLLEDHFALLRPLTRPERAAVLRHLEQQARSNPAFDLRIARDEHVFGPQAMISYGGAGVCIFPAATDYVQTADAPYCEAFLPDPAFARAFRDHFCRTLLPEYALSREESLRVLAELLEKA